jgi:hypothetical protein
MKLQPSLFGAAILFCAAGVLALFLPEELSAMLGTPGIATNPLVMQILGGALFSLGMLDWMSRFATVGGIYGRPVVITNLTFFFIATTTLARRAIGSDGDVAAYAALAVGAIFALWFARIMFGPPPGATS